MDELSYCLLAQECNSEVIYAKGLCRKHYMRQYYHSSGQKEKQAEYRRKYRAENRDRAREYMADYRKNNPDYVNKRNERAREYKRSERGRAAVRKAQHKRRTLSGAVDADYGLWCQFLLNFNYCFKCFSFENLQIDHIVPVSLGGKSTKSNVQVLCRACNTSKGNRNFMDYRPRSIVDLCLSMVNSH